MTKQATWSVVVVHQNVKMRESAVAFCDTLVERFWSQFGFEVNWWSFDVLEDDSCAKEAASKAAEADLIIIANEPGSDLQLYVKKWIESWLKEREDREGALVALPTPASGQTATSATHLYLRGVALRAGMDFWTGVPQSLTDPVPESLDSFSERAEQVTTVLDEILHHRLPPARFPG